ncbi:hypothetical protein M422DRAFT_274302 [Sphaerobolus stellatus SS14]|uniref:Uncharacterized protein n=1 Tax=Sphaerobolus stellatus (strain SS14) TaxID=990650 RepID=A0A0C9UHF6_SPHS4|nr:hypothetical protein M422DRAFT_274302 [Sphaerobolus stellatus SS14]
MSAMIAMSHVWQPMVDTYWEVVREWIAVKTSEWEVALMMQEEEKAEATRLKRLEEMKRDEEVKRRLAERKDVSDAMMKKKKAASTPKLASIVEKSSDEAVGDKDSEIIAANHRMLREKGITITEGQLNFSHVMSRFKGKPWMNPCNHCRYWVETHRCASWVCQEVTSWKAMSQLLTYRLYESEVKARPPRFHAQQEEYHHRAKKIFGEDTLGDDVGMLGDFEDRDEEEVSGIEEMMGVVQEETLGQVEGSDGKSGNESCEGLDEGSDEESGEESETESEKVTPKAKAKAVAKITESEESEETSETTSGEGEGSDEESDKAGNYFPTKGKKSTKKVVKK